MCWRDAGHKSHECPTNNKDQHNAIPSDATPRQKSRSMLLLDEWHRRITANRGGGSGNGVRGGGGRSEDGAGGGRNGGGRNDGGRNDGGRNDGGRNGGGGGGQYGRG